VWDARITRENTDHHHIDVSREHVEYYLTDINRKLKSMDITIYLRYEQMSAIGLYYANMLEVASFRAPDKYFGSQKRQFRPGPVDRVENY